MCFTVELSSITQRFLLAMRPGETPVPIPNTTVKTRTADGTALETVWESRRPAESLKSLPAIQAAKSIFLDVWMADKHQPVLHLENCIHVKSFKKTSNV